MKFYCIADEDTVRGFRLAGVDGQVATSTEEAAAALRRAFAQPGQGIVILTERVAAGIRGQVDALRCEHEQPLIVEIPGPEGPLPGRRSLRQFVQAAVGIRVEQKEGA